MYVKRSGSRRKIKVLYLKKTGMLTTVRYGYTALKDTDNRGRELSDLFPQSMTA